VKILKKSLFLYLVRCKIWEQNNMNPKEQLAKTQSNWLSAQKPRIVFVDDEDWIHPLVEKLIREWCVNATLLKFTNRDEAWNELLKHDPDLLITDMKSDNIPGRTENFGINGFEMLRRLAARKVQYPILAVSGCFSVSGWEGYAKQCANQSLRVHYLTKPFDAALFHTALNKCFDEV
jgi:CheY-like chemotaxis protein